MWGACGASTAPFTTRTGAASSNPPAVRSASSPPKSRAFSDPGARSSTPRAGREVQGDFTATVRVTFPIWSKIPAKHLEVSESRAGGGLVVWTDDENFMTVTRDEREIGDEPGEFFRTEVRNESIAGGCAEYTAPKEFGYLRAQRKGQRFEGSYSTDGTKWKALCSAPGGVGEKVRVGVVAENSFKAPFEIVFDKYVLTLAQQ